MHLRFNIAIAVTIAGVVLIAGMAQAAEPLVIRVGWAETPGHLAPLIAELARRHPEVMANDGKVYDFEPVRFPGSTPQIQALAIKQLEVVSFSDSAFALAVTNAHLDVRIVADVIQTGHPGYFPGEYVVAKDGPIKTIADVKDVEFAFTPHDFYRAPDLMPDIAAVQREIDEDVALGVLPERITVSTKYVDLSLIKAAEERLHSHGA